MPDVVFDTSAWVAFLNGDEKAEAVQRAVRDRAIVLSVVSLAELHSLVVQGRIPAHIVAAVESNSRLERVTLPDAVEGGRVHGKHRAAGRRKVSLADAVILATARRLGVGLVTLDSDLAGEPGVEVA